LKQRPTEAAGRARAADAGAPVRRADPTRSSVSEAPFAGGFDREPFAGMGLSRRSPLAATALLALAIAAIVPSARGFAIEVAFNETECFSKQIENARDLDDSHALPFRVMGAYVVSKDPHKYYETQRGERLLASVQVEVTQPDGTIIHRDSEGRSRSEFDVMGSGVGTYSICFTNAGTKGKKAWMFALPHQKEQQQRPAYVRVHYFQPVHADDDEEIEAHLAKSPKNTRGGDASVPRVSSSSNVGKTGNSNAGKALSAGHASDINVLALNLQDEVSLMRQELFYLKARAGRHKKTADSNARRTLWWTVAEVLTLCAVAVVQVLAVRYFFSKDAASNKAGGARDRAATGPGTMYGGTGGGGFGGGAFGGMNVNVNAGSFAGAFGGGGGGGAYGNAPPGPFGSGSSGAGASGVLPPPPGQGTGGYAYGGQAQGIGGASVYGNQDGLRGRGGGGY
jgi:hypothetical protein